MLDDETTEATTTDENTDAPPPRTRRRAAGRPAGPPAAPSTDIFSAPPAAAPARKRAAAKPAAKTTAPAGDAAAEAPADATSAPDGQDERPAKVPPRKTGRRGPAKKAAAPEVEGSSEDTAPRDVSTERGDLDVAADATSDQGTPASSKDAAAEVEDNKAPRARKATRAAAAPFAAPAFQPPETGVTPAPRKDERDEDEDDEDERDDTADSGEGSGPKRRRRSRGGRRRGNKADDADGGDATSGRQGSGNGSGKDAEDDGDDGESDGQGGTRRRRRRARAGQDPSAAPDDPENTVVRVREGRNPEDEITGVAGSTRLEAKKQRRREGREAGRRRAPIVTESEFLARRESVERQMVVRQREDYTQIAVLEDSVLVEHYVARESQTSLIGNVYLGKVQNVLPSMEAAFVDIGAGRNAVIYAGEVDWSAVGNGKARKIEEALSPGQTVLVQVSKDPIGQKGARLTSQVSLPGRFLVYVPGGQSNGISRKLPDTERTRLKSLLKEVLPEDAGVIVRTAAEGATEDQLTRDVAALTARWEDIERKVEQGKAPELLYAEPDLVIKVVRDLFNEDFTSLVVEGLDAWDNIDGYVSHVAPDLAERLSRWRSEEHEGQDAFAALRIDEQIHKALERKVWLPSGGSLVIDRTEAMTVVDVNTGKFTGSGGNLEETVTKNNLEAAEEIVRQLRLRDIGGIIVIDFIDMVLESNRDLVLRRLVECLGRDRTRHQVAEVTSLGLVQMTRKRIGTGLLESFSTDCDHCKGRGVVITAEPVEPKKDEQRRGRRGGGNGNGGGGRGGSGGGEAKNGDSAKNDSAKNDSAKNDSAKDDSAKDGDAQDGGARSGGGSRRGGRGRGGSAVAPAESPEAADDGTEAPQGASEAAGPAEKDAQQPAEQASGQSTGQASDEPDRAPVEDPKPTDHDDGDDPVLTSTGDAP